MSTISRRGAIGAGLATLAAASLPHRAGAAPLARLGIDYAYYNPPSLVLKQYGWLEETLEKQGTKVDWVLSLGSNKGNEFVQTGAVQFGSTAGSAAFLARANGTPLHSVFLYSQPEWTAIVIGKNSKLTSLGELKGKRIAATRGTDPWFFLLRALHSVGLSSNDVEIVELQHPDGRVALERGQVDAWAGLDPHMAASQLEAGSRLLYRNIDWNTYGSLNAREDFLTQYPDLARTVLRVYYRAHEYAKTHPDETAKILADSSQLEVRVADVEIKERTKYPNPIPGPAFLSSVRGVVPIIQAEQLVAPNRDLGAALASLTEPKPAQAALASR
jgi:sulfonate transport system substrate-binding protein